MPQSQQYAPPVPEMPLGTEGTPKPNALASLHQQSAGSGSGLINQYLGKDYEFRMPEKRLVDLNEFKPNERPHDPHLYEMKEGETVEGRLAGIMAKDSPLMQRARTGALQQANARGLLNSTMAVGAAHGAVIDKAMPIAQQDAQAAVERGNLELDHRLRRELVYIEDELKRNQMLLQQAVDQGNDQLAAEIQVEINNQQEFLARGRMELDHMQNLDRDKVQHGYNMQRDQALYAHNMARDGMKYAHETNLQKMSQDHQTKMVHLENDYLRLGKYESGMMNTWNVMMDRVLGNPNATAAQIEHGMNQFMPILKNTRDFMTSLFGDVDPKGLKNNSSTYNSNSGSYWDRPPPSSQPSQPSQSQPIQAQPIGGNQMYTPPPPKTTSHVPRTMGMPTSGIPRLNVGGGW